MFALTASPVVVSPFAAFAEDVVQLDWKSLIPEGQSGTLMETLRGIGVVQHGQLSTGFQQEEAAAVTDKFNGKVVRIPGYIVPLDFEATGITTFILAPFVGACIHVPPPPANQLILVTTDVPYASAGLYDPVYVTGKFGTAVNATSLAEIGYAMSADRITPYYS